MSMRSYETSHFWKVFVQQTYNILIMRKYTLIWWMQLLFIIWLVWQYVTRLSLPLIHFIATYMYGLHEQIHMCIWNSLENSFCYKQTIQVHVNNIQLHPIDVIWIERLREVIHLAYQIFLYAYNLFFFFFFKLKFGNSSLTYFMISYKKKILTFILCL